MRRFGIALSIMVVAVVGARVWLIAPATVVSESMRPTLCTGDVVIMHRIAASAPLDHGDIVGFVGAGTDEGVKRVVGLPGERIGIADGVLVVDGRQIEEAYVDQRTIDGVYFGPVTVPDDTVFVMGDNRELSIDSRVFGAIPRSTVEEQLLLRLPTGCRP